MCARMYACMQVCSMYSSELIQNSKQVRDIIREPTGPIVKKTHKIIMGIIHMIIGQYEIHVTYKVKTPSISSILYIYYICI